MATVFIDTCIFIDCLNRKGEANERILAHLVNAGHELVTSISVVGEMVHVSFHKGLDSMDLVNVLTRNHVRIVFPDCHFPFELSWVDKIMENHGTYGSSTTDRMHIAFAIQDVADFFVTSSGEVLRCSGRRTMASGA
jgi:predicted nucleic acid-binding protein